MKASSLESVYKATEKCYRRAALGDLVLGDAIDFRDPARNLRGVERVNMLTTSAPAKFQSAEVYSLQGLDGFRFISRALPPTTQLDLAGAALREWTAPPSMTNCLAHGLLWEQHGLPISQLSWATLGYHYQWTDRRYNALRRSPLPARLNRLALELAAMCGWTMRPEAAIINYYSSSSTMGGHVDDAEPCQTAPIVSISVGIEAVYLLGGRTKAQPPISIRLRSGDVIVQGGESRGFVHGVPRLLPGSLPSELAPHGGDEALACVARWLDDHRLNFNIRQVLCSTASRLTQRRLT